MNWWASWYTRARLQPDITTPSSNRRGNHDIEWGGCGHWVCQCDISRGGASVGGLNYVTCCIWPFLLVNSE